MTSTISAHPRIIRAETQHQHQEVGTMAQGITTTGRKRRDDTARKNHRKVIAKTKPPCWICGLPIDYSLPRYHPDAFEIDHEIPIARGGAETLDNSRPSHRKCNRAKGANLHADIVRRSGSLQ